MIEPLLKELRILVCRAEPKASELCKVLASVGASARALPCIEIHALTINAKTRSLILDLDQFSKIVVVSQHAAKLITAQLDEYWPQAPAAQHWFAIGRASSRILDEYGLKVHAPGRDLTSESLLQTAELSELKGEKILIVKGEGGRSKLEQGLRDRGAKVSCLELYKRTLPKYDDAHLIEHLNTFNPNYVIALSNDTISNLSTFASQVDAQLQHACIVVPSSRVASQAHRVGLPNTLISEQLKPIDLIRALRKHQH